MEFSIVEENDEGAFGEIVTISKEEEEGTIELDKFLIIKGPAGPWAYHVCSISEDGVKTLEA